MPVLANNTSLTSGNKQEQEPQNLTLQIKYHFRISQAMLSMWPCKNTSHIEHYFLQPHPQKLITEFAKRWNTTNTKPFGPIVMIRQSEIWNISQIIFITLSSGNCTSVQLWCPFTSLYKVCRKRHILISLGRFLE